MPSDITIIDCGQVQDNLNRKLEKYLKVDSFPKMNFSQHKNDWLRWLAAQIFFIAFISESLPWLIKPFLKIKIYR